MLNGIPFGSVRNSAGVFVRADLASVAAAAAGAGASIPDHFRVSITDAPGPKAYPISTFTWMLVPANGPNAAARKALVAFLRWALTDGQRHGRPAAILAPSQRTGGAGNQGARSYPVAAGRLGLLACPTGASASSRSGLKPASPA